MGGLVKLCSEPLLGVFGVGPGGVDARLESPGGRGRRVAQGRLLLTNGLQLADELEVEDSAPVESPMLGSDTGCRWFRAESGAASVLGWWFALSLVLCSRVPLGANVEGVGSGVGDGKHGIGVVGGVSSTELREELGFDLVSQFEVFIGVNVLG